MKKPKPTFKFICPVCSTKSEVPIGKAMLNTFQVGCPACGKTIKLQSIKGFKQVKLRGPSKKRIRQEFRDAENPSEN